jgi:maleylpyruvate isomerase
MSGLTLYTYFRSSAAYRVRIALNLKGLDYQPHFIHLLKDGGEQHQDAYRELNPQGLIPALVTDNEGALTQSLAIIEYLDESYPEPPLLPASASARAFVRSLALMVCCDIHPLNNLRVHAYLKDELHVNDDARQLWYQHWINEGLSALEKRLNAQEHNNTFCYGDTPTIADLCLIPQLYNAKRFDCDISAYPTLRKIYTHCMELEAFIKAAPENQPDHD